MKNIIITAAIAASAIFCRAQCPGCTPIDCSAQNPDGGLCDTIMIGMANHPMDEQASFYMPKELWRPEVPPSGGYVQLDKIKVTAVTGLPLGLSWETNAAPDNDYFPQSGDTVGCVRICGIPLQADTFPLIVYLLADVTAPVVGQVKNQSQTYTNAVVIILPDTSGGVSSFSISPNTPKTCGPETFDFEAKLTSPNPNPITYDWDFGNGITATGKNPPSQSFATPDTYSTTLTTTISQFLIKEVRVLAVNGSWSGDVEELVAAFTNPDLIFKIPSLGYTSAEKTNTQTATWNNLSIPIPIGTIEFEIEVWDKDNGPPLGSQDDSLGRATLNVAKGTFFWNDRNGTVTNGSIVITDTVGNVITESLDIIIAEPVDISLNALPNDSLCGIDTTTLVLTGDSFALIEWFIDSVNLPGVVDSYSTDISGDYWVRGTRADGCRATTDTIPVRILPYPPKPVFYFTPANRKIYTTNHAGVAEVRWFLNGALLTTGTSFTVSDTGIYTVEYVNSIGCTSFSDEKHISTLTTGIFDEASLSHIMVSPNPNTGSLKISGVIALHDFQLQIMNLLGQVIHSENFTEQQISEDHDIRINGLAEGIYVLTVKTNTRIFCEKIFVTQ